MVVWQTESYRLSVLTLKPGVWGLEPHHSSHLLKTSGGPGIL